MNALLPGRERAGKEKEDEGKEETHGDFGFSIPLYARDKFLDF